MKTRKVTEGFRCGHCGHDVPPHPTSSRDHCNECLYSKHVDVVPGDRSSDCGGQLKPIGLIKKGGKEQIVYDCGSCHETVKNMVAPDDNRDRLVELSTNPVPLDRLSPNLIVPARAQTRREYAGVR
jgi:hypothetical protein